MSYLEPENTTLGDICRASLKECGAIGVGQTPLAEDINDAWARLQWMLMQWERKRWLVYHLKDFSKVSTGAQFYTFGPGADFDTGPGSMRPTRLSSAFVRQLQGSMNSVDYWLEILESKEDYNRITLKTLVAGPGEAAFLDTDWPEARLFVWPVPQPFIYEIHASVYVQLQVQFATPATPFVFPWEYYNAMMTNLAIRLRPKYRMGTYPGDPLPGMAKDSLAVLRSSQVQIMRLRMPRSIQRRGLYNIFSDRPY
jgi:hypothetical protein